MYHDQKEKLVDPCVGCKAKPFCDEYSCDCVEKENYDKAIGVHNGKTRELYSIEDLKDPCEECSHKGTRGEPCLSCPKPALYKAKVEVIKSKVEDSADTERLKTILVIERREKFDVAEDQSGIELNEGYQYTVDAALPELADGIAKMAKELDHMDGFSEGSGGYFVELIKQFYDKEV